ncbi:MAG: ATP-binding protein [Pseudomonadota bacterium]
MTMQPAWKKKPGLRAIDICTKGHAAHATGERRQAIVRLAAAIIFGLYLLGMVAAGWRAEVLAVVPAFAACLLACLLSGIALLISPAYSKPRCLLSMGVDQACLALLVFGSGAIGAPFLWCPIAAAIDGGRRFGKKIVYFSSVLGAACMSVTMFFSSFWQQMPFVALGIILAMCVVPACAAALSLPAAGGREEEAQDETVKKRRLHQAERAHVARLSTIGEMASGIAHEINQPLAAILSYNQACIRMLKSETPDIVEIVRAMTLAAEQAKRAGVIIKGLRSFVKKQPGRMMAVDLNEVIANALILIEHGLRDHQIVIHTRFQQPLPAVRADSIQLEQVVLNLIRNAIDAMNEMPFSERQITLSTFAAENTVSVEIMDQGPGVQTDSLPQVFNPFFTTKADGMGLGLTISHSIIDGFGGTISVRNAPQRGAISSFTLPAIATAGDDADSKEKIENARTSRVPG